jgi:hypothetical protein
LVPVIIQPGGAPSHHDPNKALDQISADNLTQDAPADEDKVTRTAHRERNQHKEMRRTRAAERARLPPRNLNNEFNNAVDPISPKILLNNSRDRTPCPHFTVRDQGVLQQQYLKQAVPPEATSVNVDGH